MKADEEIVVAKEAKKKASQPRKKSFKVKALGTGSHSIGDVKYSFTEGEILELPSKAHFESILTNKRIISA